MYTSKITVPCFISDYKGEKVRLKDWDEVLEMNIILKERFESFVINAKDMLIKLHRTYNK